MRKFLSRTAAAAAVLLVALPAAAGAAVDEYVAESSTSAVKLSVFENVEDIPGPVLDLIGTEAFGSSDPVASASIDVVTVLGTSIGEVRTAESDRERVRDPEEGDGCTVPDTVPGLTLTAICTTATARAGNPGDTGNQDANATADLLNAGVSGSFLADALTTPLGDVLVTAGDILVEGAIDEFLTQCNELIGSLNEEVPEELTGGARDLIAMTPEELQAVEDETNQIVDGTTGEEVCDAVFNLTVGDLSEEVLDVTPIADALAGQELVTLTMDGASSDIAGTDTAMGAEAEQVFVTIGGPSLDFLDDVIIAVVDAIVAEIEEIAGGEEPLPLPEDFDLSDAFDAIPLFGITDPLLTGVVSGGAASADLDLESGETTSGGDAPFVTISIAGGVMELFGQDPETGTVTLEAGEESGPIAEGTPLESSITVGALTTDDDAEHADTGLRGSSATASATTVSLLTGVEDGIVLSLARSDARVYASVLSAAETPDEDPLPNTGGGAAFAAALALGAALVLRRRRD